MENVQLRMSLPGKDSSRQDTATGTLRYRYPIGHTVTRSKARNDITVGANLIKDNVLN
jgi:hypothetical protein